MYIITRTFNFKERSGVELSSVFTVRVASSFQIGRSMYDPVYKA